MPAQNLVLNPDFGNTSSCPTTISELYLATNWSNTCIPPTEDSCSSPDLFATCASQIVNIPNTIDGYHQAYTGTHMAGMILGDGTPGCGIIGDNFREYIEGTLSTPLVAGQNYLVKFYVSLASGGMWGSNSYGVYFSNAQYLHVACPTPLIPVTPQLTECGPAIMDTVNWVPIQWIYTATGGEQYFTIGNFNDDAHTNHTVLNCNSFQAYIYYYVGYVNVSPVGPNDCGVTILTDSVNTTCGFNNGKITIRTLGCPSPFSYSWSNGGTDTVIQNLASGTYTVTVTDALHCHETVSVSVNAIPLAATETGSNPSCGSNNGSAIVNISNGTGAFNYAWSNGATTQTLNNLDAGTYYVTVTGAQGCAVVDSISLLGASGITLTPSSTASVCSGSNGSASVSPSGGAAPYSYRWSNGDTTQTVTGLAPGTYSVTVIGDTSSAPFWTENFANGSTGWTLNTPGSGSNEQYANQWIVNNNSDCNCGTGNYLHVTCNSSSFFCITQPGTCTYLEVPSGGAGQYGTDMLAISPVISTVGKSNITLTFTWISVGTPGSDYGRVNVSNNGGATWTALPTLYFDSMSCSHASVAIPIAYQNSANFRLAFEWINGPGSVSNSGNPPGFAIWNIALTAAASNCPAIGSVNVGSSSNLSLTPSSSATTCGGNNGSASVSASGGSGYTYTWSNGGTTASLSNLPSGNYSVTVSASGGCSATSSASVSSSTALAMSPIAVSTTCGLNNGSVSINIISGTSPYTYSWSNSSTTSGIANLSAGSYSVTVSATGGCSATASAAIDTSTAISLSTLGGRAGCTSTGTASVSVTEGNGPFTYLWSNSATAANLTALSAGNYTVTVTGAGNCSASATVAVTSSVNGVTLSSSSTASGCNDSTGSATATPTTGTSPFVYVWSNGGTSSSIQSIPAGTYSVTVTGSGGCSATANVSVSASGALNVTTSSTNAACGSNNGTAWVTNAAGSLTYAWSNGATTDSISNLAATTYTVTVLEGGGCSGAATVTINPSGGAVSIQAQPPTVCQGDTSQICAPAGFTAYHWNVGASTQCISVTQAGNYYLTVTGSGNCTATSNQVTITVNAPDSVSITQHDDTLQASGALTYQWYLNGAAISGATSSVYVATQAGSYYAEGIGANGCSGKSKTAVLKGVTDISQISDASDVKVYPNPLANGSWHLDVTNDWVGSDCEVYDAAGRLIFRTEIKGTQSEIELNVAQGIYLLRITSAQKNYAIKLIKL